jgi:phosphate transport system substrate-binding protein
VRKMTRTARLLAVSIPLAIVLAGCGSDGSEGDLAASASAPTTKAVFATTSPPAVTKVEVAAPEVTVSDVSGTIEVSGSSTVEPVSVRVAELFEDVAPNVIVNVDGPGTGDGFELFCNGETDISDASRAIKDAEAEDCAANGIEFIELQVGIDGIAVMTNAANSAVECVTKGDLYALIGPESEGFDSWADANAMATELGGKAGFPDAPLEIFGPGAESGTFDSFNEMAFKKISKARGTDYLARADYVSSSDDNVILRGIQGSDTSLGWVGFAFAANATDVKLIGVDGGDGCVTPTPDTIASGEYPLSRPLFIYVNPAKLADNPALVAYVDFYMTDNSLIGAVAEVGYVPLASDHMALTRGRWMSR